MNTQFYQSSNLSQQNISRAAADISLPSFNQSDASASTRWLNILGAEMQLSDESKQTLSCLFGVAQNRKQFNCSYPIIYKQMKKSQKFAETDIEKDLITQFVRRRFNLLDEEQQLAGLKLFSWQHGGIKQADPTIGEFEPIKVPSSFTLYFIDYFEADYAKAKSSRKQYGSIGKAMDEVFQQEIKKRLPASIEISASVEQSEKLSPDLIEFDKALKKVAHLKNNLGRYEAAAGKAGIEESKIEDHLLTLIKPLLTQYPAVVNKYLKDVGILPATLIENERDIKTQERAYQQQGKDIVDDILPAIKSDLLVETLPLIPRSSSAAALPSLELAEEDQQDQQISPELSEAKEQEISRELAIVAAGEMIQIFSSVGADQFDFNLVEFDPAHERGIGRSLAFETLNQDEFVSYIPQAIELNRQQAAHVFVRPRVTNHSVSLLQLDDLDRPAIEQLQSLALITIETSPENYQAVLAIDGLTEQQLKAVKAQFVEQLRADSGANGSYRLAGSLNLKPKYGPAWPKVEIINTNYGRLVTGRELAAIGISLEAPAAAALAAVAPLSPRSSAALLCPSLSPCSSVSSSQSRSSIGKLMPAYEYFLRKPHYKADGSIDYSAVDFAFCSTAIKRGFSSSEIEAELKRHREKAAMRPDYAARTVANAERACQAG